MKRPIDIRRESAGQMEIGTPEEGPITGSVQFDERLLIVKANAIYEFVMADSIDPERTCESIPDSQQRIFSAGSENMIVGRTLLTADALFNSKYLPKPFDRERGMQAAFRATYDLLTMQDEQQKLLREVENAVAEVEGKPMKPGFAIPAIVDLEPRGKAFLQRADHFVIAMLDIVRLFLGSKITHADSLLEFAESTRDEDDRFRKFIAQVVPLLRFNRKARNAVEHPKPTERAIFTNFKVQPDGKLVVPTIELIHSKTPQPATEFVRFCGDLVEELSMIFETFIAFLCDEHAKFDKFQVSVVGLDEKQRRSPHVRYSYAVKIKGQWIPLG